MHGLPNNLSLFRNDFNAINSNTNDIFCLSYDINITLKIQLWLENVKILSL